MQTLCISIVYYLIPMYIYIQVLHTTLMHTPNITSFIKKIIIKILKMNDFIFNNERY